MYSASSNQISFETSSVLSEMKSTGFWIHAVEHSTFNKYHTSHVYLTSNAALVPCTLAFFETFVTGIAFEELLSHNKLVNHINLNRLAMMTIWDAQRKKGKWSTNEQYEIYWSRRARIETETKHSKPFFYFLVRFELGCASPFDIVHSFCHFASLKYYHIIYVPFVRYL